MLNYELAKKLKDAGFLQTVPYTSHNFKTSDPNKIGGTYEACVVPTLSEFIEACGDKFGGMLRISKDKFQAMGGELEKSDFEGQGRYIIQVLGATPEEAVANLWLALHTK